MNKKKFKKTIITGSSLGVLTITTLLLITLPVAIKDPFMFYHKGDLDTYNYALNHFEKDSINSGLIRYNDYDSVIIGSASSVEGFSVEKTNKVFNNSKFLNLSFTTPSFKETNDILSLVFEEKKEIKHVIRSIDTKMLLDVDNKYAIPNYPGYLYDNNWGNDICYLFNPYAIRSSWDLIMNDASKETTPNQDRYINALYKKEYGINSVLKGKTLKDHVSIDIFNLTTEEKEIIQNNIDKNLIEIAKKHPDTSFTYFVPPYSYAYYGLLNEQNKMSRIIEAKQLLYKSCIDVKNIKLYDFDYFEQLSSVLENYYSETNYGPWINDCILDYFLFEKSLITPNNYEEILNKIKVRLYHYPYKSINKEIDVNDSFYQNNFVNPY